MYKVFPTLHKGQQALQGQVAAGEGAGGGHKERRFPCTPSHAHVHSGRALAQAGPCVVAPPRTGSPPAVPPASAGSARPPARCPPPPRPRVTRPRSPARVRVRRRWEHVSVTVAQAPAGLRPPPARLVCCVAAPAGPCLWADVSQTPKHVHTSSARSRVTGPEQARQAQYQQPTARPAPPALALCAASLSASDRTTASLAHMRLSSAFEKMRSRWWPPTCGV
jgi:hypothetical protein